MYPQIRFKMQSNVFNWNSAKHSSVLRTNTLVPRRPFDRVNYIKLHMCVILMYLLPMSQWFSTAVCVQPMRASLKRNQPSFFHVKILLEVAFLKKIFFFDKIIILYYFDYYKENH